MTKWKNFLAINNIRGITTTKYHPQSNPVERYNKEIGRLLRTFCSSNPQKWNMYITQVVHFLNQTVPENNNMTPLEVFINTQASYIFSKLRQLYNSNEEDINTKRIQFRLSYRRRKQNKRKKKFKLTI